MSAPSSTGTPPQPSTFPPTACATSLTPLRDRDVGLADPPAAAGAGARNGVPDCDRAGRRFSHRRYCVHHRGGRGQDRTGATRAAAAGTLRHGRRASDQISTHTGGRAGNVHSDQSCPEPGRRGERITPNRRRLQDRRPQDFSEVIRRHAQRRADKVFCREVSERQDVDLRRAGHARQPGLSSAARARRRSGRPVSRSVSRTRCRF